MASLWYAILALSLATYAVMDGFDLGAGLLHPFVAKNDLERRTVFAAIGPFWDGNEVWLLASGGVLFVAFPTVLAAAFSGFYLALFLLLWSLILRGAAIEFRSHLEEPLWRAFWDVVFAAGSSLLSLLFGVVIGNLVRGVPIDASGQFSMALFTDWRTRGEVGVLDWYTVSVGVLAVVALAAHGATFLVYKSSPELEMHGRCKRAGTRLWPAAAGLFGIVTLETFWVRPALFSAMAARPLGWALCLLALVGGVLLLTGWRGGRERRAFIGSCLLLYGVLGAAAAALYPVILASTLDPGNGATYALTADNAKSGSYGLATALLWWPLAFGLVVAYFAITFKRHQGKVSL